MCFPPGVSILDTIGQGDSDTILIDISVPEDSSGLPAYAIFSVRSLGDTTLAESVRIHFTLISNQSSRKEIGSNGGSQVVSSYFALFTQGFSRYTFTQSR